MLTNFRLKTKKQVFATKSWEHSKYEKNRQNLLVVLIQDKK